VKNLKKIWQDLALQYTSEVSLVDELWTEILKHYSANSRYYHNLVDIEYMTTLAFKYKTKIADFDTLLFSIFYHDIIYNTRQSNNELKSAKLATERLANLDLSNDQIDRCYEQILATKEHMKSEEPDTNFLIDFDLAILGDDADKYLQYTKRVRKEYAIYPDFLNKKGRKKVLKHFLAMNNIFKTQEFIKDFEDRARRNLQTELENHQ
jgi:predicted metal-dependent HD superfamily phosphohydrolase